MDGSVKQEKEAYIGQHKQIKSHSADGVAEWRFSSIPRSQIEYAAAVLQRESLIRIVCDICANGIVGGGVVFSRSGFQMEEYAQSFYSETWKKFIHNLLLKLWTFGFAGVVLKEHNRFKAVPRVLDPELVNIKVYREPTGDSQYIFSERRDTLQHGPSGAFPIQHITGEGMLTDKPIPGVMVFEMDPPDQYGNLRSKVMCALEPRQFMQHLMRAECLAVSRMSDPPILLQHNNNNATDLADSVKVAVAADQSRIWQRPDTNGGMRRGAINLQGHNATLQSTLQNLGYKVNLQAQDAASGQVDGTPYNVFANQGPQLIDTVGDPWGTQRATFGAFASGAPMTQKVDLGPNREAKQHTPAREPQHLLQVMANYEERVAAIWGVPRSFFAQFSAGHKSDNPDGRLMFDQSQRALKQFLIPLLNKVFDAIYGSEFALDTLAEADDVSFRDVHERGQVNVSLPGLPPVEDLWTLYLRGALRYEAMRSYLSQMYGIAMDDLHKRPQLTLKELNGIQEQPQEPAEAGKDSQTAADSKKQQSSERMKETTTETSKVDPKTGNMTKTTVKIRQGDNTTDTTGKRKQVSESSADSTTDSSGPHTRSKQKDEEDKKKRKKNGGTAKSTNNGPSRKKAQT